MLLVDNFRVFMVIGLICASRIAPSQAGESTKCKAATGFIMDCTDDKSKNCGVDLASGGVSGCVADDTCPAAVTKEISCEVGKANCCCSLAGDDPCNDFGKLDIYNQFCALPEFNDTYLCKEVVDPPVMKSSSTAPGGGDPNSGTSFPISTGIILTVMSLGTFWSHDTSRICG